MIQISNLIKPDKEILDKLVEYQSEVDKKPTFEEKSAEGKRLFKKYNSKSNATFKAVKIALTASCSGARRCIYCEDSVGDEVEHIYPKDLYPNKCFSWENYIYACGPCNGPKNNLFAIFREDKEGAFEAVNPPKGEKAKEPAKGETVLLNPRVDNPFDFCMLDLINTFKFSIIAQSEKDKKRADYTLNDVLRLNEREYLREARQEAFGDYKARMIEYDMAKSNGVSQVILNKLIEQLQKKSHPTVWAEIKRYQEKGYWLNVDIKIHEIFIRNPEALNW